jgi:hypothetical protein
MREILPAQPKGLFGTLLEDVAPCTKSLAALIAPPLVIVAAEHWPIELHSHP